MDPKRLLDDSGTPNAVSDLLRSLDPPTEVGPATQLKLARALALGPVPAPAGSGLFGSTWLKVGVGAGAALIAGAFLVGKPAPAPQAPLPVKVAPAIVNAPEPPAAPAGEAVETVPEVAAPSPPTTPSSPARALKTRRDTLAEEEALLEQARRLSRSAPGQSLSLLQQHQARYPNGQLTAERLFLASEVSKRLGDSASAAANAAALKRRFPNSVYAKQVSP